MQIRTILICVLAAAAFAGCSGRAKAPAGNQANSIGSGTPSSGDRIEKSKPAPGTANVQGKVLYKNQPFAGAEIQVCKNIRSSSDGSCSGEKWTATSDAGGEYLITGVRPTAPGEVVHVIARMSGTKDWIFVPYSENSTNPEGYYPKADQTIFANPIHLFKADLYLSAPPKDAEIDASFFAKQFQWQTYQGAAYYKIVFFPADPYSNSPGSRMATSYRADTTSYTPDLPRKGTQWWKVEAFDSSNVKIAESDAAKFTVTKTKE